MATEFGYFSQKPTAGDHFMVEDLLDFSHDDNGGAFDSLAAVNSNSAESPASSADLCNSSSYSFTGDVNFPPVGDFNFSGDISLPHEDLAELEWLSNFVEESFSGMSAFKARPDDRSEARFYHHGPPPQSLNTQAGPAFGPDMPVPGKARSKRSRAAPGSWASRLVHITSSPMARPGPKNPTEGNGGEVRRCLHCASEKTPQWRAGPLGPKTLCNACGVRYKSGRLVPEYRPAASPTFVQTEHSNSHRKVVELRRQKVFMRQQQMQQQQLLHHYPNSTDEYMIHHQVGSDFRKTI